MISNKQFLAAASVVMIIGFICNILFYFNTDATADVIFQGSGGNNSEEQKKNPTDVKKLQRAIADSKANIVKFQKFKNPMGIPVVKKEKTVKKEQTAPYKLQGIWYEKGGNSTAIIDGNMVQAGQYLPDRVSKVMSITRDQVVIKRSSKKFVLKLGK